MAEPSGSIRELTIQYKLDKCEKLHDYARFYDLFFSIKKNDRLKLLEIGIHNGDSLRMWNEYFPNNIYIVGIDIVDKQCICKCDCHDYEFKRWTKICKNQCKVKCPHGLVSKCLNTIGIATEIGDQSDPNFLDKLKNKYGTFDIIIDDGSHFANHQQISFKYLFNILNDKGIYVIEDLHHNYENTKYKGGGTKKLGTTVEFLKDRIDDINLHGKVIHLGLQETFPPLNIYEREIDCITFCKSLAFIMKSTDKISKFQNLEY